MTNPTMLTDTYRKIAARLTMFRPQIDLTKYFAGRQPGCAPLWQRKALHPSTN